ncbi:hypothetical protein FHU35_111002 [Saccharopolyspora dendranthemae]|uniref:Uncharacterized protein n=1 Tax=Saccharopolyspora dendranthemae TaxID=1181886 RepID=A0A561V9T3_9PSEU|nr:hypothetical protein FHU35_111002 [Saccharopolyspora dendranthemae]
MRNSGMVMVQQFVARRIDSNAAFNTLTKADPTS